MIITECPFIKNQISYLSYLKTSCLTFFFLDSKQTHTKMARPYPILPPDQVIFNRDASGDINIASKQMPEAVWSHALPTRPPPQGDRDLPGDAAEGLRKYRNRPSDGKSHSENKVTFNAYLHVWPEGHEKNLFEGKAAFVMTGHDKSYYTKLPLICVADLNRFLATQWRNAQDMLNNVIPRREWLTTDEIATLRTTPTILWSELPCLKRLFADTQAKSALCLNFLFEEGIRQRFNFYGFPWGQKLDDPDIRQITISRAGRVDDVECIWGNDVKHQDNLYFCLRRRLMPDGTWGPFAFVPLHNQKQPDWHERMYIDYNGNRCLGYTFRVGSVVRYLQEVSIRPALLAESQGFAPVSRIMSISTGGALRVCVNPIPGKKLHWLY
jgi:hypothetical protein